MVPSRADSPMSTDAKLGKTDSVINLTRSSLYGIYNDNSELNLNKDYDSMDILPLNDRPYVRAQELEDISHKGSKGRSNARPQSYAHKVLTFAGKIMVLSLCAFLYNEATKHIHNRHIESSVLSEQPLLMSTIFLSRLVHNVKEKVTTPLRKVLFLPQNSYADYIVALVLQGSIMGLVHPIMDSILPPTLTKRLLSSNPNNLQTKGNIWNDLLRSLVTFLGISYAVRKIEWSSSLQALMVWSLLNPGLWLLLDGTISGFLSSVAVAGLACVCVYYQDPTMTVDLSQVNLPKENAEMISPWLWVGSFFFCSLIIFGKIGRGLFSR